MFSMYLTYFAVVFNLNLAIVIARLRDSVSAYKVDSLFLLIQFKKLISLKHTW